MSDRMPDAPHLGRRHVLIAAGAVAAALTLPATVPRAETGDVRVSSFETLYEALTRGATPAAENVAFELPEIAENGNTVPFTVSVASPMTDESHVTTIHILSTQNPQTLVATFTLSPLNGKAVVASRMRLARSQDVLALAVLNDGRMFVARRSVKVTVGGCGI